MAEWDEGAGANEDIEEEEPVVLRELKSKYHAMIEGECRTTGLLQPLLFGRFHFPSGTSKGKPVDYGIYCRACNSVVRRGGGRNAKTGVGNWNKHLQLSSHKEATKMFQRWLLRLKCETELHGSVGDSGKLPSMRNAMLPGYFASMVEERNSPYTVTFPPLPRSIAAQDPDGIRRIVFSYADEGIVSENDKIVYCRACGKHRFCHAFKNDDYSLDLAIFRHCHRADHMRLKSAAAKNLQPKRAPIDTPKAVPGQGFSGGGSGEGRDVLRGAARAETRAAAGRAPPQAAQKAFKHEPQAMGWCVGAVNNLIGSWSAEHAVRPVPQTDAHFAQQDFSASALHAQAQALPAAFYNSRSDLVPSGALPTLQRCAESMLAEGQDFTAYLALGSSPYHRTDACWTPQRSPSKRQLSLDLGHAAENDAKRRLVVSHAVAGQFPSSADGDISSALLMLSRSPRLMEEECAIRT